MLHKLIIVVGSSVIIVFLLLWRSRMGIRQAGTEENIIQTREMIAFYQRQVTARKLRLQEYSPKSGYGTLYNVLCTELTRVGTEVDGGKWVCNPFSQQTAPCSIYSLGVNNEISFDVQIQQMTNKTCKLYAYDMGQQKLEVTAELEKWNGSFRRAKITAITNETTNQYTIGDLMKMNRDTEMEMLKMDVEKAEHTVLPPLLQAARICQIFIEVHGSAYQMVTLLKIISAAGFYLFSYEINGFHPQLCEFSFIHDSCLAKYKVDIILGRYLS